MVLRILQRPILICAHLDKAGPICRPIRPDLIWGKEGISTNETVTLNLNPEKARPMITLL